MHHTEHGRCPIEQQGFKINSRSVEDQAVELQVRKSFVEETPENRVVGNYGSVMAVFVRRVVSLL